MERRYELFQMRLKRCAAVLLHTAQVYSGLGMRKQTFALAVVGFITLRLFRHFAKFDNHGDLLSVTRC